MPFEHETVKHSISEYVNGMAHTNGIESFWATLKRGYHGTFHHISPKHLHRYVNEFATRHNLRTLDTEAMMAETVARMVGKRLMYKDLVATAPRQPHETPPRLAWSRKGRADYHWHPQESSAIPPS